MPQLLLMLVLYRIAPRPDEGFSLSGDFDNLVACLLLLPLLLLKRFCTIGILP